MDLLSLLGNGFRRVAAKDGGEWAGPCPWCGGRDRFHVWPARDRFWCRSCERKGDSIQLLRDLEGLSFREACERVGKEPSEKDGYHFLGKDGYQNGYHFPKVITIPGANPPSPAWQEAGRRFVVECQARLWEPIGVKALSWLKGRGLTEETIRAAGLGYNPAERKDPPKAWGLEPDHKPVWLPRGVVIPWKSGGELWRVNIRRPIREQKAKYVHVAGGQFLALYNADVLRPGQPAMIVEGDIDCLAVVQAAGDLAAVVAAGTTTGARRARWIAKLALASPILVSFDADPSGDEAAAWWLERLGPSAQRWRPWWDDPAALLQAGADLRSWLLAGLVGENWEAFEERAAIMEYDGGLDRQEAERMALECMKEVSMS